MTEVAVDRVRLNELAAKMGLKLIKVDLKNQKGNCAYNRMFDISKPNRQEVRKELQRHLEGVRSYKI